MAGALGFLVHNVSDGGGKTGRFGEDVYEKGRDRYFLGLIGACGAKCAKLVLEANTPRGR
jgi:hypothetical protein